MEGDRSYSVIPAGELRCVWMDAGVVSFKLCDRNLECDECPFDADVRRDRDSLAPRASKQVAGVDEHPEGAERSRESFDSTVAQRLQVLAAAPIPQDLLLHRNHFWLSRRGDNVYRVGITHIAAGLLRPVLSIVRSNAPSPVRVLEPCCWLVVSKGTISVPSPLNGTVIGFNPALLERPSLLDTDPYGEGWMVDICAKPAERSLREFTGNAGHGRLVQRQVNAIRSALVHAYRHRHQGVGETMFDGGVCLRDIETILGPQDYFDVINRIFRVPLED